MLSLRHGSDYATDEESPIRQGTLMNERYYAWCTIVPAASGVLGHFGSLTTRAVGRLVKKKEEKKKNLERTNRFSLTRTRAPLSQSSG
ncbi:hypothetical protein PUN28_010858 [Cardiocondyla obscurior]|uniref:Uncharacterized protein n=1 Tax=Cardiocondyla obscurior TaxID=286306 RepID=A0AAW2FKM7_9HYME